MPPPPPAPPPPGSPTPPGYDPHGIGPAATRLENHSKRAGERAFSVLGALLREGERVEGLIQGRFNEANGVVALTNMRLIAVNDKSWKPDVVDIAIDPGLDVQGWQEDRTATLVLRRPDRTVVLDRVLDGAVAAELANNIRGRISR